MSRTKRKKRPKMQLGKHLENHQYKDGRVRDGTPQYASASCENHGGCPVCEGNKKFSNQKRLINEGE